MKNLAVIILAAGKGTRMKSHLAKALHPVCSRPMLGFVLDMVKSLKASKTVVVLGHQHDQVKKILPASVKAVRQKKLQGTADAVKEARLVLGGFNGTVLILYADIPLLKKETVSRLIKYHNENSLDATILTAHADKPFGYGRIVRDKYASISGIVEEKDATEVQKDIKEINTGIICFNSRRLFEALKKVRPNNRKREYYLTDVISILYKDGALIDRVKAEDINEAMGINSRQDLSRANKIMQSRINENIMKQGVSLIDCDSTFINFGARIGQDTVIYPFTVIEKGVKIGKRCSIGPFAHLREGTIVQDDCIVGNFIEIVRSRIGSKTLVKHFGYLGDSQLGRSVNIGAGAVTANFDGKGKHVSVIKDNAFIGSDTVLVSPVRIGKSAKTGAGSVVVRNSNVADKTVVVGVPARILKLK